jgi:anti-sigma factor RsiW
MTPSDVGTPARERVDPIDCKTAVMRLWDFLDGRLPTLAHAEVEKHLATCALCPPHFEFARSMQSALANSTLGGEGDDEARLTERVRAALRRHAGNADGTPD